MTPDQPASPPALHRPPMTGYRIADMATVLTGPLATRIFGDCDADMIKIELSEDDMSGGRADRLFRDS